MWSALALSVVIAAVRIFRKQSLIYALAGVGSVAVAIGIAWFLGKVGRLFPARTHQRKYDFAAHHRQPGDPPPDGGVDKFHRPPLAFGLVLASAGATRLQRSDFRLGCIFRRPSVPAIFGLSKRRCHLLAVTNFITGWPATILLLVFTYLYGTWRLAQLQGPSVDEFKNNTPAPWQGQRRGF